MVCAINVVDTWYRRKVWNILYKQYSVNSKTAPNYTAMLRCMLIGEIIHFIKLIVNWYVHQNDGAKLCVLITPTHGLAFQELPKQLTNITPTVMLVHTQLLAIQLIKVTWHTFGSYQIVAARFSMALQCLYAGVNCAIMAFWRHGFNTMQFIGLKAKWQCQFAAGRVAREGRMVAIHLNQIRIN